MILSNKDLYFIIEAVEFQLKHYQANLKIAEIENNEDYIADLGNDIKYLELLLQTLKSNLPHQTGTLSI
jgi:hypothetical protein